MCMICMEEIELDDSSGGVFKCQRDLFGCALVALAPNVRMKGWYWE